MHAQKSPIQSPGKEGLSKSCWNWQWRSWARALCIAPVSRVTSVKKSSICTHSYVNDSYVTWLTHMRCDSFTCESCHKCEKVIHLYSFIRDTTHPLHSTCELCHKCEKVFICTHSYVNDSYVTRLIHMRHDSFIRDLTHPLHSTCESRHKCESVTSQIWTSHVTRMNPSLYEYEWGTSQKYMNKCEWVMSQIWMSHVTHTNESRLTYEWDTSHIRMSHATHLNESRHTYE